MPEETPTHKTLENPASSERMWFFYHPDYFENGAIKKCLLNISREHSGRRPVEYITDMGGLPYGTSRPQRLDQYFFYTPCSRGDFEGKLKKRSLKLAPPSPESEAMREGEALKDQKATTHAWESPYAFNGKELDEETGLYYYGARYYNPQVSVWLSVDALAGKYPNLSPYAFVANNPVMLVDPDGNRIVWSLSAIRVGISMMFSKNGRENWRAMRKDKFVDFKFRISSSVGMLRDKITGDWGVVEGHTYKESESACTMVMTVFTGTHKLKKEAENRHGKDWHDIPKKYQYSFINSKVRNGNRDVELIEDSGDDTGRIHKMDNTFTRNNYTTGSELGYQNTSKQGESRFKFIGRLGKHESTHGLINSGVWKDPYPQNREQFPQEREQ